MNRDNEGDNFLSDMIEIEPVLSAVSGDIRPPGSKSITNRALICAALAEGDSQLSGALDSEDTRVMFDALQLLGVGLSASDNRHHLSVDGTGGLFSQAHCELNLANSGTSIRFLTALSCLVPGQVTLDGIERMRQRPIGDLVDALNSIDGKIEYLKDERMPPIAVSGSGRIEGGLISIKGDISSQFLSALMMVAPYAQHDVSIRVVGELVSIPYVEMTRRVMAQFGVAAHLSDDCQSIEIKGGQRYQGRAYAIEPDASAASYFWSAAAITGGDVTVLGLDRDSMQGDVNYCDCLRQMGCGVEFQENAIRVTGGTLRGIDVDMNSISDTVQSLAAVALFADGPTRVRGVAHNRHKETDRIGDLATELRRLGATVDEFEDGLQITPGPLRPSKVETYNDHRMAMSLALVGLRQPGIQIKNPACTAKTYPEYFLDLKKLVS